MKEKATSKAQSPGDDGWGLEQEHALEGATQNNWSMFR